MTILIFVSDDRAFVESIRSWSNSELELFGVIPTRSVDTVQNEFDEYISENTLVRDMFESKNQAREQYIDSFSTEYRIFCLALDRVSFYCSSSMFSENLFNVFVERALDFLTSNNIRQIIFGNVPHQVQTVAFQVSAQILDIDIYHRELPAIGSGAIALWFKNGSRIKAHGSIKIPGFKDQESKIQLIAKSISKIEEGENSKSRFDYMVGQSKSRNLAKLKYAFYGLKFFGFIPWIVLLIRNREGFLNTPHISQFGLFKSYPSVFAIRKIFLQKKRIINSFLEEYENTSSAIPEGLQYFYFPLHYQPEASTVPLGWPFHNQIFVAHKIADNLPDGMKLVVKEHPTQFHLNYRGDRGRWFGYYQLMNSHENIVLAPIGSDPDIIIRKSKGVVSVNGSTVLESGVKFKKASVVLANDTYHGLSRIRCEGSIDRVVDLLLHIDWDHPDLDIDKFSKDRANDFFDINL